MALRLPSAAACTPRAMVRLEQMRTAVLTVPSGHVEVVAAGGEGRVVEVAVDGVGGEHAAEEEDLLAMNTHMPRRADSFWLAGLSKWWRSEG